jgi:hypothetical protein
MGTSFVTVVDILIYCCYLLTHDLFFMKSVNVLHGSVFRVFLVLLYAGSGPQADDWHRVVIAKYKSTLDSQCSVLVQKPGGMAGLQINSV